MDLTKKIEMKNRKLPKTNHTKRNIKIKEINSYMEEHANSQIKIQSGEMKTR